MLKRKFTPEQESFWRVTEYVGPRTFKLVSGRSRESCLGVVGVAVSRREGVTEY